MPGTGQTLAQRFRSVCEQYPQNAVQLSKNAAESFEPTSFAELLIEIKQVATRLNALGVSRGEHIGLISDNCREWLVADLATLSIGAIDVPRGSDSTDDELAYILAHADCKTVFAENETQATRILKLKERLPLLEWIIVMQGNKAPEGVNGIEITTLETLAREGAEAVEADPGFFDEAVEAGTADDVVTIIYTSGTTGEPKGVMLTNRNYTFQLDRIYEHIDIQAGHTYLSVLPSWHSFERAVEYVVVSAGAALAYSKPIGAVLTADMKKVRPQWTAAVPRLWEAIRAAVYRNANTGSAAKTIMFHLFVRIGRAHASLSTMFRGLSPQFIRRNHLVDALISFVPLVLLTPFKALGDLLVFARLKGLFGGRFIAGISGGGALPPHVDGFFRAAGIKLLEGYGLTETAPILSVRMCDAPVPGTVGPLLRDIEYRVVGDDMAVLPPGKRGVLYVKSEQVMQGYYKRPEATEEVLKDGWLNTGDIVEFTHNGELAIIGRAKETIVLLGGENIEPAPIEDRIKQSDSIDQVMVIGQDRKYLAALIVPNSEQIERLAADEQISYIEHADLLEHPAIQSHFQQELQQLVSTRTGFKPFERIFRFKLLAKPFEVGDEMTHTLKVRRNVVEEKYVDVIEDLFS